MNKTLLVATAGAQSGSSVLSVAYSADAYWLSGWYMYLFDQDTDTILLDISRTPQEVEVEIGQKLYVHATTTKLRIDWHPDRSMGDYLIEGSAGVVFTNIPSSSNFVTGNLEFYITGRNASVIFSYK